MRPLRSPAQLVVFSDVDGVFRRPEARLLPSTAETFARLDENGVSVVLCSTKTRAELEQIQRDLGLHQPFIAEAGAAAFVPKGYFAKIAPARDIAGYYVREFGAPYGTIVRAVQSAASRLGLHVIGVNDMTVEDIAREWRLPLLRARLAKFREYIEPFTMSDADPRALPRLTKVLETLGVYCGRRGGLVYATGVSEPSAAMLWLLRLFEAARAGIVTIGLAGATIESPLFGPVVREAFVLDDDRWGSAVDVHGWAEGIADLVDDVRRHLPRAVSAPT